MSLWCFLSNKILTPCSTGNSDIRAGHLSSYDLAGYRILRDGVAIQRALIYSQQPAGQERHQPPKKPHHIMGETSGMPIVKSNFSRSVSTIFEPNQNERYARQLTIK